MKVQSLINNRIIICGACDEPAAKHGSETGIVASYGPNEIDQVVCYRQPEDIGRASWLNDAGREFNDYVVMDNVEALSIDTSGPACYTEKSSNEGFWKSYRFGTPQGDYVNGTYLDEQDYVSPTIEEGKLERWADNTFDPIRKTWIGTVTREQHVSTGLNVSEARIDADGNVSPHANDNQISSQERNAYVEGNDGFLALKLLDEQLTKRYQERLLNVYRDQYGEVRCGSIKFVKNADGTTSARCVKCYNPVKGMGQMTINPETATRDEQEQFVWAVIAHGNNHAARWFRERETFYTLHHSGCDMSEDLSKSNGKCTYSGEPIRILTEDDEVKFLMDHNSLCRDSKCKCSERLAEMVPALAG